MMLNTVKMMILFRVISSIPKAFAYTRNTHLFSMHAFNFNLYMQRHSKRIYSKYQNIVYASANFMHSYIDYTSH